MTEPLKCPECGYKVADRSALYLHLICSHNGRPGQARHYTPPETLK